MSRLGKPVKKGKTHSFVWKGDEVDRLLKITIEYKVAKTSENADWDSCQTKYSKAPFTRVQTNFCTDEFCSRTACLHVSVQILFHIAVVFTCFRANFKTSHLLFVVSLFAKQRGKNITRFQVLTALSEQKSCTVRAFTRARTT